MHRDWIAPATAIVGLMVLAAMSGLASRAGADGWQSPPMADSGSTDSGDGDSAEDTGADTADDSGTADTASDDSGGSTGGDGSGSDGTGGTGGSGGTGTGGATDTADTGVVVPVFSAAQRAGEKGGFGCAVVSAGPAALTGILLPTCLALVRRRRDD